MSAHQKDPIAVKARVESTLDIFANMIFIIPTILLALFVATLWSVNHYWRNLSVSWLATVSVTYFALANFHEVTLMQRVWLLALASTLLLWSLLLTPIQLLVTSPEERQPTAQVEVLWDPFCIGVGPDAVNAECVCTGFILVHANLHPQLVSLPYMASGLIQGQHGSNPTQALTGFGIYFRSNLKSAE